MTKRLLLTLLVAASLSACDTASGGLEAAPSADDVSVVDGRLVFRDSTAFANFVTDAKKEDEPVLALLNWGDRVGFRSVVHAEALAEEAPDAGGDGARTAPDEAPVIGGDDRFFKSLLSPEGELQVGDQLLRVDATHSTLYAADGSVVRRAPIEEPQDGADANARTASLASAPSRVDRFYGPVDTPPSDTRNLQRFRVISSIDTDEYLIYWSAQGITDHDKLKRNWYRGWYYGDENAQTVSVTCTTTFYEWILGERVAVDTVTETDSATNRDYVDVQIDWTFNVGYRPPYDATCTHYFRNREGYSDTITTSRSRY